jgi:hypothetical protein
MTPLDPTAIEFNHVWWADLERSCYISICVGCMKLNCLTLFKMSKPEKKNYLHDIGSMQSNNFDLNYFIHNWVKLMITYTNRMIDSALSLYQTKIRFIRLLWLMTFDCRSCLVRMNVFLLYWNSLKKKTYISYLLNVTDRFDIKARWDFQSLSDLS